MSISNDLTRQLHPVTQATTGIRGGFSMNIIMISSHTAVRMIKMASHAIALVSRRRYKSSTEVQAELKKQGLLLESKTDTAEESLSEYEPSPVKKPRNKLQPSTSTYV